MRKIISVVLAVLFEGRLNVAKGVAIVAGVTAAFTLLMYVVIPLT